jgi:benzoyl-CoA reductase/2-hydroxyglutaryl-CoA dehydratase subunit BcrC/BadD/HgdB
MFLSKLESFCVKRISYKVFSIDVKWDGEQISNFKLPIVKNSKKLLIKFIRLCNLSSKPGSLSKHDAVWVIYKSLGIKNEKQLKEKQKHMTARSKCKKQVHPFEKLTGACVYRVADLWYFSITVGSMTYRDLNLDLSKNLKINLQVLANISSVPNYTTMKKSELVKHIQTSLKNFGKDCSVY